MRTRETQNPHALQFVVNAVILDHGNVSFANKEEAKDDKMATALFEKPGVINVYAMENFITVTKDDKTSWVPLKDRKWKANDDTHTDNKTEEKIK